MEAWGAGIVALAVVSLLGGSALAWLDRRVWAVLALLPGAGVAVLLSLGAGLNAIAGVALFAVLPSFAWLHQRRPKAEAPAE